MSKEIGFVLILILLMILDLRWLIMIRKDNEKEN